MCSLGNSTKSGLSLENSVLISSSLCSVSLILVTCGFEGGI